MSDSVCAVSRIVPGLVLCAPTLGISSLAACTLMCPVCVCIHSPVICLGVLVTVSVPTAVFVSLDASTRGCSAARGWTGSR